MWKKTNFHGKRLNLLAEMIWDGTKQLLDSFCWIGSASVYVSPILTLAWIESAVTLADQLTGWHFTNKINIGKYLI